VVDQHIATRRRPLAEARPVVDDREPWRVAVRDGEMEVPVFVDRADMDEMRKEGTSRIELFAVDDERLAVAPYCRLKGADVAAVRLGEGVAESIALKRASEPKALLLSVAVTLIAPSAAR
jgi:hypothetical protein